MINENIGEIHQRPGFLYTKLTNKLNFGNLIIPLVFVDHKLFDNKLQLRLTDEYKYERDLGLGLLRACGLLLSKG